MTVVVQQVVEDGVCVGNETSDNVGDWEDWSKEFFLFPVLVHSAQDIRHNVGIFRDVVNGEDESWSLCNHPICRGDGFAIVWCR